jgi:hypothetical protein
VDGYGNSYRKIPDNYRSKVKDRVTRNYNGHILRRCIDHGLTRDEQRQFTPKPCDFNYAEKNNPETDEETEQHSTAICHFNQGTVSTQMILQLKPSALTTKSMM